MQKKIFILQMFRLQKLFAISSVILRDNVKIMSLKPFSLTRLVILTDFAIQTEWQ